MKKRIQLLVQLAVPHLRIRTYIQSYYLKTAGSLARLTAWRPRPERPKQTDSVSCGPCRRSWSRGQRSRPPRSPPPAETFNKIVKSFSTVILNLPKKKVLAIILYTL